MRLLWDTDVLSEVMKRKNRRVAQRAASYTRQYGTASISFISRFEVLRGLIATNATTLRTRFETFCLRNEVVPLEEGVIVRAAEVWADLKRQGQLIPDADLLIAATALYHGWGVATGNVAHFSRVPGLVVEDWFKP